MTWRFAHLEQLARQAECFETPEWAPEAILDVEIVTPRVVDPGCGRGWLSMAAERRGHHVTSFDLHDWGYGQAGVDFMTYSIPVAKHVTVFMNPPFSQAVDWVERSWGQGVRKIICFQRFPWYESVDRRDFWAALPPNRVYVCESRASCWRIDIAPEDRKRDSPTTHAWYVWERGHPVGSLLGRLIRPDYTRPDDTRRDHEAHA